MHWCRAVISCRLWSNHRESCRKGSQKALRFEWQKWVRMTSHASRNSSLVASWAIPFPDTAIIGTLRQMRYPRKTINNTVDVEREIPDYCVVMVCENGFSHLSKPLDLESLPN
ncbi:hypothetical protein AVEN_12596-1 [Araneus ventricosus]|uniref:Uncharacterized protein n=1 Tax=Araneus ventricosus TaxID=182803 RepID=A0A4Y2AB42_ARAVE|nr:hypothetical protein AVEN_12596-1 [Araneus ventricosus]